MKSDIVSVVTLSLVVCISMSVCQQTSIQVNGSGGVSVMPGQSLELSVTILWNDTQSQTPSFVTANVVQGDAKVRSSFWVINGTEIIKVVVQGTPNQTITLSFCIAYGNNGNLDCTGVSTNTSGILLKSCTTGFKYNETHNQCVCDERLSYIGILCSVESESFHIPPFQWFGLVQDGTFAYTHCLEDYCTDVGHIVLNSDFDFQCTDNRTGVACGSCKADHSTVFGSSQCKVCGNYTLSLLFLFFVTGLLTVAGIALLKITLTEGYLNGVLFYSNIVNLFAAHFTMPTTGKGAFFLTAWISQSLGIPSCFYDGMTSIAATGFHLLYIGYLFVLTLLLAPIMRYKLYAPSKVLSTLLVICYIGLLEISIRLISYSKVVTLDDEVYVRWRYDANVDYFSGIHTFFFILAVLLLVCLMVLPLFIISPRITYKIRVFNKLQPFLDTIWAPLKPKYRWWVSFRLLLRWIIFLVALFVRVPNSIISTVIVLSLLLFVQSQLKPFRGHWQNTIDEALVLNLCVLLIGYLFFYFAKVSCSTTTCRPEFGLQAYSAVFAVLAYLLFMVVFAIHMFSRFPKCKQFLSSIPEKLKTFRTRPLYPVMEELDIQETDESPVVTFSEINLSREEREDEQQNLTRELRELESLSISETASKATGQTTGSKSIRPKLSLREPTTSKGERGGLPLTVKRIDFSEDREPLLADDSV